MSAPTFNSVINLHPLKFNNVIAPPRSPGVPPGGLSGQVLAKTSSDPFKTGWITLGAVARSNDYNDLDNKPSIPSAQVQTDWNETNSALPSYLVNRPATSTGGDGSGDNGKIVIFGSSGGINCSDYIEANSADPAISGGIALYHEGSVAGIYIGRGEGSIDIQIPALTGNWTQFFQDKAGTYAMLSDIVPQVQSDWTQTNDSLPSYLANKPSLGTVATLDYSFGGDGEDDNGKIPRYQSDGSLFVSTSFTVNGSGTGVTLSPASLSFSNNGYFAQVTPPSSLSGSWSWLLQDGPGTIAFLSDIPTGSAASLDAGTGANQVLQLDSGGKVPLVVIPDSLLGQVQYQGLWSALLNIPYLPDVPTSDQAGHYWICNENGNFLGVDYLVGDWIIDNSGSWGKVNNTDAVTSVAGRKGDVTLSNSDISGLGAASLIDASVGGLFTLDSGKALTFGPDGSIRATDLVTVYSSSSADIGYYGHSGFTLANGAASLSVDTSSVLFNTGSYTYGLNSSGLFYNGHTYSYPPSNGTLALVSDIPAAYVLPTATNSVLGGVKTGTGITNTSGTISVTFGTTGTTACVGNDSRLDLAATTHAATSKATPVDADEVPLVDSAASNVLKKLTWANIKAAIKTYLNGVANTWSLSQTFTANLTANGTHNTAPNQVGVTPTTGDFIVYEQALALHAKQVTRDRALMYSITVSSSGAGAAVNRTTMNAGQIDGSLTTSSTSASYVRLQIVNGTLGGAFPVNSYLIKTDHAWSMWFKSYMTVPANVNFLIGIGCDCATGIPASGNHIGVIVDSTSRVRLWKCVAGTITYSSDGAISNIPSSGVPTNWHQFWVDVDGAGNASLYVASSILMSGLADKPSSAVCTLPSIPTTLDGAQLLQVYRATGTPGAYCYVGLGDCKLIE